MGDEAGGEPLLDRVASGRGDVDCEQGQLEAVHVVEAVGVGPFHVDRIDRRERILEQALGQGEQRRLVGQGLRPPQ